MISVILSGGAGSRLWPLSRGMYPKQLLPLVDPEHSLLQQTVARARQVGVTETPIVICNQEHRFIVAEQLQQIKQSATIILEPVGRNTAPAIALAAFNAQSASGDDPLLLVMPADHVINDLDAFSEALEKARLLAQEGKLVTFGIVPTHAETGYGYIRAGEKLDHGGYGVSEFIEKPDAKNAQRYIDQGNFYWNGGVFLFRASVFLRELKSFSADVFGATEKAMLMAEQDLDFLRVSDDAFRKSPSISIDYAVMEKTQHAAVVPLEAGWSDIGSWSALWDISKKNQDGNVIQGDVIAHDTKNSHIVVESGIAATLGVEDLVIVQTADALLVASRDRSQDVKNIVAQLKNEGRNERENHRKVYRPWGWYDSIDVGVNFQVKRIQVKPGAKLSVQMHYRRAEHWVVVSGVAEVLNGENTFRLQENQSTYIPIGVTHALSNPSDNVPLEIIEVQSGDYLGEDDIVRFEDNYGRVKK